LAIRARSCNCAEAAVIASTAVFDRLCVAAIIVLVAGSDVALVGGLGTVACPAQASAALARILDAAIQAVVARDAI
jgi:hypothetical protein